MSGTLHSTAIALLWITFDSRSGLLPYLPSGEALKNRLLDNSGQAGHFMPHWCADKTV